MGVLVHVLGTRKGIAVVRARALAACAMGVLGGVLGTRKSVAVVRSRALAA
jgi:hypothetical protein